MAKVLVAFGANLGDPSDTFKKAFDLLEQVAPSTTLQTMSPFYQTQPIGGPSGQAPFLNGAFVAETELKPYSFFCHLQKVEAIIGRQQTTHWGERAIDLDLLFYDQTEGTFAAEDRSLGQNRPTTGNKNLPDRLTIPHRRLFFRQFVLRPATFIAPNWYHTIYQKRVSQLLDHWSRVWSQNETIFRIVGLTSSEEEELRQSFLKQQDQQVAAGSLHWRQVSLEIDTFNEKKGERMQTPNLAMIVRVLNNSLLQNSEPTIQPKMSDNVHNDEPYWYPTWDLTREKQAKTRSNDHTDKRASQTILRPTIKMIAQEIFAAIAASHPSSCGEPI
ncbi:MAG: 2-amino-4-hydroxy-6-hydroxymethyldihydropteridine diphosphokinase [Pirellulaceae bacterium]|nr:2-amino-4-hydroxy-6-hydroxymethyldihydropteridine diphosphokinase [Pirellulaceae bacterium]